MEEEKKLNKVFILVSLHTKVIFVAWTTDVTWTILAMSLLPVWALNVSVVLLSMQGQKAPQFHTNILICVPKMNENHRWVWNIHQKFLQTI